MFERSELVSRPEGWLKNLGTRRAASLRSPFLGLLSFGEAKESDRLPGRPRLASTEHKPFQLPPTEIPLPLQQHPINKQKNRPKHSLRTVSSSSQKTGLLDSLHHRFNHFLRIPKHHHGFIHIEQLVIQPGITRGHRTFVDDDRFRFVGLQNRHPSNR